MAKDPIFQTLPIEALNQITQYLRWNPVVTSSPVKFLSALGFSERLSWLDNHRDELEEHISWVGTPVFSYAIGNRKTYREIVASLADQFGVKDSDGPIAELERKLLEKLWSDTLAGLSPEKRREMERSVGAEIAGFAGLAAAQASGFGVYMLGSTLLGALNSALGLGLSFGAFTTLSSAISVIIGPFGWAALGLYTIGKLGGPNYKKLLPVVILIATERARGVAPRSLAGIVRPLIPSLPDEKQVLSPNDPRTRPAQPKESRVAEPTTQAPVVGGDHITGHPLIYPPDWLKPPKATAQAPARSEKSRSAPPPPDHPTVSKAEKRNFYLRPENQLLREVTEENTPGRHYLELTPDEREIIDGLVRLRLEEGAEDDASEAGLAHGESISGPTNADRNSPDREGQPTKPAATRKKQAALLVKALPGLKFHPAAIDHLGYAPEQVIAKLGQINLGQVNPKCTISNTNPKILEFEAGYDYRIYAYRDGPALNIVHIGDKDNQTADIRRLRLNGFGPASNA